MQKGRKNKKKTYTEQEERQEEEQEIEQLEHSPEKLISVARGQLDHPLYTPNRIKERQAGVGCYALCGPNLGKSQCVCNPQLNPSFLRRSRQLNS